MTEQNYNYRTDPFFLRNQFKGTGKYNIPQIPRPEIGRDELYNLLLIGFDRTRADDEKFSDRFVHFFLYDYKFERVWKNPDNDIERLKRYRGVLSPDFSMYREMAWNLKLYNTFRSRWCGAYFAGKGLRVIPTVSWGDEDTFDFCFDGITRGSIVAVSTYMAQEHGNHAGQKDFFLKGYNEMLRRIEPEKIICYSRPFEEMDGDIIYVDYDLSGWRHMGEKAPDASSIVLSRYVKHFEGQLPNNKNNDIIIKRGYIPPLNESKGMGSAFGGDWIPKKDEDKRFLGRPGEIKTTYKNGYRVDTKIGDDGRAVKERHYTDHRLADKHTNPHDHIIKWDNPTKHPDPQKAINYPDGAPEFKMFGGIYMNTIVPANSPEENRFESISDFKDCMRYHGEVEFIWKGKSYSITHLESKIFIGEGYYLKDGIAYNALSHQKCEDIEGFCGENADDILEYIVGGDRLRDVITKVDVIDRTI